MASNFTRRRYAKAGRDTARTLTEKRSYAPIKVGRRDLSVGDEVRIKGLPRATFIVRHFERADGAVTVFGGGYGHGQYHSVSPTRITSISTPRSTHA